MVGGTGGPPTPGPHSRPLLLSLKDSPSSLSVSFSGALNQLPLEHLTHTQTHTHHRHSRMPSHRV